MGRLLLVFLVAFTTLASPAAFAYNVTVIGLGMASCGTWTADRKGNGWPAVVDENWVLGFLSGAGIFGPSNINPLGGTDDNGVFGWVDNYCKTHPLAQIDQAGEAFVAAHPQ